MTFYQIFYQIFCLLCGIAAVLIGIHIIHAAVTKNMSTLQGRGYLENKYQLGEKLWFRICAGIFGGLMIAGGILICVDTIR